jgi:CRP/FNR family transcriptional regulator, cyclic AMP receptor protein
MSLPAAKKPDESAKKSGIKTLNPGDILFNEKDSADSLYIIQSGQIRLYTPKGKGFVEIGVLRAGEVIGEMAYFEEASKRKRSCTAAAISRVQIVEVSFAAFDKTMQTLNPWFKTIINTMAERLRKSNDRIRSLEGNSVGFAKDGKAPEYKFLHNVDVVRFFAILYLTLKTHGELKEGKINLHVSKLRFYAVDVFNFPDVKYEELLNTLKSEQFLNLAEDEDGQPKIIQVTELDSFRSIMIFFNTQRMLDDEKRTQVSYKCERILKSVLDQMEELKVTDAQAQTVNMSVIFEAFKERNIPIAQDDFTSAVVQGLAEDIYVGEGGVLSTKVNYVNLKKIYPSLKMVNALRRANESKQTKKY